MEQDIASQIVGLGGATLFIMEFIFYVTCCKICNNLLIASSIFSWALIFDKFKLFKQINKTTEF